MKRPLFLIILALLAFAVSQASAQDPTPTPRYVQDVAPENVKGVQQVAPDYRSDDRSLPAIDRVGVDVTDQRTLSLDEAIDLALTNNKDIEVSRKVTTMAEFDLRAARGAYEPRFTLQSYFDRTTTPNVSIFSNNSKTTVGTLAANAGFTGFVPKFGTVLTGGFNNSRVTTDNPISILSPQYNSNLNFGITQPLVRGRKFDVQRRSIEIAKKNIELTDRQFEQRTIEIVTSVEKAYWDLTFALRNLQVQRDAVRDAKAQVEHNRRLVAEGSLAPIDIIAGETQVANLEQAVYDALNVVNITENALKNFIAPNRNDAIWSKALTPVEPVAKAVPDPTLSEAIGLALKNRPELEINTAQKEFNAIDQRYYRELRKPQIDLVASFGESGIGGSQNPHFSPTFPTPCTTAPTSPACAQQQANLGLLTGSPFTGIYSNRYPSLRFGVNFTLPLLGDKTNSALLGKAKADAERLDALREQLEQGIQVEVRNALQAVRTGEARLRAAAISRENSQRQYESEQRKLDEGQSDVYRVLERQTALTAAKSNELRARTELNKAIADLQRATGNALKANNIEQRVKK